MSPPVSRDAAVVVVAARVSPPAWVGAHEAGAAPASAPVSEQAHDAAAAQALEPASGQAHEAAEAQASLRREPHSEEAVGEVVRASRLRLAPSAVAADCSEAQ